MYYILAGIIASIKIRPTQELSANKITGNGIVLRKIFEIKHKEITINRTTTVLTNDISVLAPVTFIKLSICINAPGSVVS